ncbi:hypothetical protein SLS62_008540 [Diatrype stigma]|uniref:Uncharacterized protein n=1 Tax=Diatrype stigma TaxID=117547 RepID=A0AAN9UI46_9PEZI
MPNMASADQPRPSIDSVYNLLQGLDDSQAEDLLRDLNHTAPSNVPVAEALDFFEGPADNNLSGTTRRRRRSTFLKSVSTFDLRTRNPSSSSNLLPSEPTPPLPGNSTPRARSASAVPHGDEEARRQQNQQFKTPRAYKRISRPWATLAPPSSGGPDVRDLLMAYLSGSPTSSSPPSFSSSPSSSSSSFSADSPATPRSTAASPSFYPCMIASMDTEPDAPPSLADLLEPSPLRMPKKTPQTPQFAAIVPPPLLLQQQQRGPENISGIFEVLSGGS